MKKKSLPLGQVYRLIEQGPVVMLSTSYKGVPNVMTMSWHMMMEFEPPLLACIVSGRNYTFDLLKKTKECVINIPTVELAELVVAVGNCSGAKIDKFEKFHLAQEPAAHVDAPLLSACYVNLECKVVDTKMAAKYNMFVLEVVKAWVRPTPVKPRMIHHGGKGIFVVDGDVIKLPSKKK